MRLAIKNRILWLTIVLGSCTAISNTTLADDSTTENTEEDWAVHASSTTVVQGYPKFWAAYSGANSLKSSGQVRANSLNSIYFGTRLWKGAEFYTSVNVMDGYGLSGISGAAGYPNSTARKGSETPYLRLQRVFLRQTIDLDDDVGPAQHHGGLSEQLDSIENQLAGKVSKNRLTFTLGKFSVADIFGTNIYANDSTIGFLNYNFNALGTFNFVMDNYGYTYGGAVEWKQNWWTLRSGIFQAAKSPESPHIDPKPLNQFMGLIELESRYTLLGRPGALKFLLWGDYGKYSKFTDVINLSIANNDFPPSVENLRRRRTKLGFGINLEQQLAPNIGLFLRAGINNGNIETVRFTDINKTISTGLVFNGNLWHRSLDEVGTAFAVNHISGYYAQYLNLGGLGRYVGDGKLNYGNELTFETYYKIGINKWSELTFDYQFIKNPAYNKDRGPANFFGIRFNAHF